MAAMLVPSSRLLLLLAVALWMSPSMLLPASMADHTVQPASSSAAAQPQPQPQSHLPPAGPTTTAATLPAATTSSPAAAAADPLPTATPAVAPSETTAAAAGAAGTAPKKFPLPPQGGGEPVVPGQGVGVPGEPGLPAYGGGGAPYNPVAEVAGALPVPTPDELPSGASLGFGEHGGLGYGGPGDECCGGPGGYGWFGGPGGFGPGTYGYSGPLYWGAATAAAGLGRVTNILLPLLVASISAAIFA